MKPNRPEIKLYLDSQMPEFAPLSGWKRFFPWFPLFKHRYAAVNQSDMVAFTNPANRDWAIREFYAGGMLPKIMHQPLAEVLRAEFGEKE